MIYYAQVECSAPIDGSVNFVVDGKVFDTEPVTGSGYVSFGFSGLSVGDHSVYAAYSGGNYCSGSSSDVVIETIYPD